MAKNKNIKVENGIIERTCVVCGKKTCYTRKSKPKSCPHCKDKYWDKPVDERDLFVLQDEYIKKNRDKKVLDKMYVKILEYSRNIIINATKNNMLIGQELLEDKSEDLASILTIKYLSDPNYVTMHSFGGYLIKLSKGILYNSSTKNNDQVSSLDSVIDDKLTIENNPNYFINDTEAKDAYEKKALELYNGIYDETIIDELSNIIEKIYERISKSESRKNSILFLIGLDHFFKLDNEYFMTEYYNYTGNIPRQLIENTKMFIRNYLIDREG